MNHPPDSERAVSELFGAMVLIGVIVTGLAIAGVMLLSQPQPQKIPDLNALFSSNAQTVQIQHNGGDPFLKSELQIRLDGVDKTSSFKIDGTDTWSTWSVGQSLTYDIPSGSPVPSLIQIVYTGGGISQLIASSGEGSTTGLSVQAPVVNSITPNSGNVGDTVHITNLAGSYFFSGATVKLSRAGSSDIPATNVIVVSSTQITCDFSLPGATATQGAWDVVVTNPNGPSGTLSNGFTVLVPPPTITGISPAAGPTIAGTKVNITGTNLSGATSVTFGPSNFATIDTNTATTINMTAPAGTGTVTVTVNTPGGTATTAYTYTAAPTISSISPAAGPTTAGTKVNITGTNLAGATSVTFGSNAATINTNTDTAINMTAPAGTGTVTVTVTTPGGTATTSYTYAAAPTISSISPSSGIRASGTRVNITGTNLAGATSVTFGSNAATINTNTATAINMTAPAGTGTVTVTVTTPGGTATTSYDYFIIQVFTSSTSWPIPTGVVGIDYLVVAGGGGGGGLGGGGGAGGVLTSTLTTGLTGSKTVTIGTGGAGGTTARATSGGNSVFGSGGSAITATGGGGGGTDSGTSGTATGAIGGSGGGGARNRAGGTGASGQGFAGGTGGGNTAPYEGGGGGGKSAAGATATNNVGGDGGDGVDYSATFGTGFGVSGVVGGGGGGGATSGTGGIGGTGGGGNGAVAAGTPGIGLPNTGGGGGASGRTATRGGTGGSGVIVIRYY